MASQFKKSVIPTDYKEEPIDKSWRSKLIMKIANALGRSDLIAKSRKTVVPQYTWDAEPRLRRPLYDYVNLVLTAQYSWVLRKTFDAIIKECTRNWGHIEPKFKLKCRACNRTFQSQVEECPCGSKDLAPPNPKEYQRLSALISKPSPDRGFAEFVRSTLFFLLATDDVYWSVVYKPVGEPNNLLVHEVYVEHPGYIFPISDRYGNLGGYQYFCPKCYFKEENKGHDLWWDIRAEKKRVQESKMFRCPKCRTLMIQTAYVQDIGGVITARFGRNEIVHLSASRLPPELFGNSRLVTLVKVVNTLSAIDDHQLEQYSEGKIGGLLLFPGLDQARVTEILQDVKTEREKLQQRDAQTGELEPKKRTALIFVGLEEGEKPLKIPFLDSAEAAKTLEFYKLYVSAVEQVYGVDITISSSKRGDTKTLKFKVEVRRETAQEIQMLFSEAFNNKLLPLAGIKDWMWVWNKLEPKDRLRDAEILHQTMAAAVTAINAGLNIKFEDDVLHVWGESSPEQVQQRTRTGLPNVEPGVAPRRVGREMVTPFEISPETGEEITARTEMPERLVERLIDIFNFARERSQRGKERLETIKRDARTEIFRLLSRTNIRLDKREALFSQLDNFLDYLVIEGLAKQAEGETGIPISWLDLTKIELYGTSLAIEQEQDEVYITRNGKEIPGTRRSGADVNLIIARLIELALRVISAEIKADKKFPHAEFSAKTKDWIASLKHEYSSEVLRDIALYLDQHGLEEAGKKLDNLRSRLDTMKKPPLHVEPTVPQES